MRGPVPSCGVAPHGEQKRMGAALLFFFNPLHGAGRGLRAARCFRKRKNVAAGFGTAVLLAVLRAAALKFPRTRRQMLAQSKIDFSLKSVLQSTLFWNCMLLGHCVALQMPSALLN